MSPESRGVHARPLPARHATEESENIITTMPLDGSYGTLPPDGTRSGTVPSDGIHGAVPRPLSTRAVPRSGSPAPSAFPIDTSYPAEIHRATSTAPRDVRRATSTAPGDVHRGPSAAPADIHRAPSAVPADVHRAPSAVSTRHTPRALHSPPMDTQLVYDDAERARQDRFEDLGHRMQHLTDDAEKAEDHRERDFRQAEEARQRLFLDAEARREQEQQATLQHLASVPTAHPPIPQEPYPAAMPARPTDAAFDTTSIIESVHQAASVKASEIMDNMRAEREDMAREREESRLERESLLAELQDTRDKGFRERDVRIAALEQELADVRAELANERAQKTMEDAETRERDRAEFIERDESLRNQLGDITNLVHDQRQMLDEKKARMEILQEQKASRRLEKESRWDDFTNMLAQMREEIASSRQTCEEGKAVCEGNHRMCLSCFTLHLANSSTERLIDDLQRQAAEQQELLREFSEGTLLNTLHVMHEGSLSLVNHQVGVMKPLHNAMLPSKRFEPWPMNKYPSMCKAYVHYKRCILSLD